MPKIVDHNRRRRDLVEVAWRVVARSGLEAMTLRDVAAEAGFANGAIKPYFATKASLVEATYSYVFERTNLRVAAAVEGLRGLDALRVFGLEVLPLDSVRIDEARVVIPFWQVAIHDPDKMEINAAAMGEWRSSMSAWLGQARDAGEITADLPVETLAEGLLTFLLGAQVAAVLDSGVNAPERLEAQLDAHLERLRP
ncbi:TetR/AcrR family transcriptional regulator [Arthrobacter sp. KK5.5]|uniref:TetR/AcrR family transcriptional regulator n=1 Tax=Arthrobacter sp. KK5.5 TaxID=3373084 RepID=UPI003EE68A14